MGLNFEGVNGEVANKLKSLALDGKITSDEVKGLTEVEKEETCNLEKKSLVKL